MVGMDEVQVGVAGYGWHGRGPSRCKPAMVGMDEVQVGVNRLWLAWTRSK